MKDYIKNLLADLVVQVIEKNHSLKLERDSILSMLEQPPDSALGDYALPCFRFAKMLRQSPPSIAQALKKSLDSEKNPWVSKVEVVGAFLNIFISQSELAKYLLPKIANSSYFNELRLEHPEHAKTRVMIEFSQPNTHKEFHVGHLRNVCLGETICRLYSHLGYAVIPANYIGDEGTHVAKCLWQVLQHQETNLANSSPSRAEFYGQCYVEANKKLKLANPEQKAIYEKEISDILRELEAKKGSTYELWQKSRQECLEDFKAIYSWLGVQFDHYFFESEVSEEAQQIVDEYVTKGLFQLSDGAMGIDLNDCGLGFFMAPKSDGTTPYITKDLSLARRKFDDFKIDRSIYVVANEQIFHFKQLFKALELMGFPQSSQCHHLNYASVNLPEGKMSSRLGNVITFSHLKKAMSEELAPHLDTSDGTWTSEEREKTLHKLAVGAIKYGMLSSDPAKEILFDIKLWTSFEGNSGPYLMYSYARTRSMLRRCTEKGLKANFENLNQLDQTGVRELIRYLYDFNASVFSSYENYRPSTLAHHLYSLCKAYNRFYAEVPVLREESPLRQGALIALIECFSKALREGLGLLGISPPERM
ncbi:MAG: arginine--tRNA ligase [Oligoflexales bacterium]|nr:arginine--tRNA ligase [Oligoflexales bacterium]